jgi:hypothetical protein
MTTTPGIQFTAISLHRRSLAQRSTSIDRAPARNQARLNSQWPAVALPCTRVARGRRNRRVAYGLRLPDNPTGISLGGVADGDAVSCGSPCTAQPSVR